MRKPNRSSGVLRAGDFEVDLAAGELRKDGQRLPLERQPFQVLGLLMERSGKVVTREEILRKLWSGEGQVDPDRSLDLAIGRLRQALGDPSGNAGYFETIPGRGYRFIAPVTAGPSQTSPQIGRRSMRPRKLALAGVLAAAVAVTGYMAIKWPSARIKLAVLPFNNLSGTAEDERLSDGMTDEMITRLGRVQPARLGVIAATSVWPLKHAQESILQIGQKLGVNYVVEGSVSHDQNRLRISAKLIEVADETQVWTDSYDRPYEDVLAIESEVAGSVARSLALKLLPAERTRLAAQDHTSPQAHEAYLNGRYHWNRRTLDGFLKSIEYYDKAIAIEPNYAAAYAGLADTYDALGFYSISPPGDSYGKARVAARKALEIDDSLAEAHAALAQVLFDYDFDWKGGAEEFQRAIQLNENLAAAHDEYSLYLALAGKEREGLAEVLRAHDLDPLSLVITVNTSFHYLYARKFDLALQHCQKALQMEPNFALAHFWLGRSYQAKGMYSQAITEFRRASQLQPQNPLFLSLLGNAYGTSGQKEEAQKILGKLKDTLAKQYVSPVTLSLVYAGLDDRKQALDWAEKAFEEHAPLLTRLKMDPVLDRLRSEPRFQQLLQRVGPPE
jgi:TolB-like protein/DNA-binding winged helix-turn-helix (wHTH) protein/Tfp pilus assembly protein PilF